MKEPRENPKRYIGRYGYFRTTYSLADTISLTVVFRSSMYKQDDFDICFRRTNVSLLPSGCLPLRIRRYVQKSKFDHFSPDSNVVAYRCKPFRDRQADSWDISLSDIAVDPICRTSLDSRCKEDPEKGEKIESPGYRFLWYLSVFLVNLVLAILLAAGICLAGYTLAIYNEV